VNDPLRALLHTLLLTLGSATVLLVIALVVVRATGELLERRAGRRRDELRGLILAALLGEPDEAEPALAALRSREGRAWRQVERQAFAMLPKIKGDSHEALVALLRSRGAVERAYGNTRARSLVRRSRGAYQLGALGDRAAVSPLLPLLTSEHFLVRRTAVRALGQIGDPIAAPALLDAVTADPALARDVIAALQRIGPEASPHLSRDLGHLVRAEYTGRRGALVATVLGLHGDIGSVPVLIEALRHGRQASFQAAAAEALGEIGVPSAVPPLVGALGHTDTGVRVAAAVALGKISDASVAEDLAATLGTGLHDLDRALAGALLRLGPAGVGALERHRSPYATEALALHRMRTSV
jgi:hypothetical protein